MFVIVGVAFRSLVVPLRTVLTIGVMLVATFGAGAAAFEVHTQSLEWFVPVLSFFIMLGVGLDFEIFLARSLCGAPQPGGARRSVLSATRQVLLVH